MATGTSGNVGKVYVAPEAGSEEIFEFICTACKDTKIVEAEKYCRDCDQHYCVLCVDFHKHFPALKNHVILDKDDVAIWGTQILSGTPESCKYHPGKLVELFCGEHKQLCCHICVSLDHRLLEILASCLYPCCTSTMTSNQVRGCGRGVFALSSWKTPLRRPECLKEAKAEMVDWRPEQQLMMKYKYMANADSPLGKELTVKQKDNVMFVSRHDEHWIVVRSEAGEEGYVPASYVMANPDSVKSLPWLDQKSQEEKVKQENADWKPYKSAYAPKERETTVPDAAMSEQFYCKVCEKQLNGPIPYRSHLASKAHKEEMDVAESYS